MSAEFMDEDMRAHFEEMCEQSCQNACQITCQSSQELPVMDPKDRVFIDQLAKALKAGSLENMLSTQVDPINIQSTMPDPSLAGPRGDRPEPPPDSGVNIRHEYPVWMIFIPHVISVCLARAWRWLWMDHKRGSPHWPEDGM